MLTSRPRLYWKDQLANWEAYSILNTLRLVDLARSCIWALARHPPWRRLPRLSMRPAR
jgi:hypothetical protein